MHSVRLYTAYTQSIDRCTPLVASFPGPVQKSRRGPGIFSHVSDVGIERMVERV